MTVFVHVNQHRLYNHTNQRCVCIVVKCYSMATYKVEMIFFPIIIRKQKKRQIHACKRYMYLKHSCLQRHNRAAEGLSVTATLGNVSIICGSDEIVCNGPLDSNTQYRVRYTLFSGNQSQEYPFFNKAHFTTGRCVT